jgi:hypothetical protein
MICLFIAYLFVFNYFLYIWLAFIDHFDAVAGAILSAKSEIYIEDWWLTPELVSYIYIAIL